MPEKFFCLILAVTLAVAGQPRSFGQGLVSRPAAPANNIPPRAEAVGRPGAGADAADASPAYASPDRPSTLADPNRKLQQGDELSFKIEQDKEPAIPLIVSPHGELVIEPIERPVRVAGMTTGQAASEIQRLLEKDYYFKATVRLALTSVNVRATMGYIYIDGAVNKTGALPVFAERPPKLSEVISTASGFARYADGRKVKLTRMRNGVPTTSVHDVKAMIEGGKLDQDVLLQDGDRIFVPTRLFQY